MKSTLVVSLIEAHSSGNEKTFEDALKKLASDEEKKGNFALSNTLLNAYKPKQNFASQKGVDAVANSSYSESSLFNQASTPPMFVPKDKDTSLELYEITNPRVSLKDMILSTEQENLIENIIKERKNSEFLESRGFNPTNRLLLCGPPGCGKTLAANVIAHELDLPLVYVRLDGLISSYLGQTSSNIRKIFDSVKHQKVVLFLDEFDAIAKKRDDQHELGELKRVVNTLLQNFDSLPSQVMLIAATNHHHLLDPAIWRRFDVSLELEVPSEQQRKQFITSVFEVHKINCEIELSLIVKALEGLSGAQIKTIVEQTIKEVLFIQNRSVITEDDMLKKFLNTVTMNTFTGKENWKFSAELLFSKGVPQKVISRILDVPKSTLNDFIKERMNNG